MSVTVRNTDDHERVYPTLATVDGDVLVLGPHEQGVLPEDPGVVAHLEVVHDDETAAMLAAREATTTTPGGK